MTIRFARSLSIRLALLTGPALFLGSSWSSAQTSIRPGAAGRAAVESAEIYYDAHGLPHVFGDSDEAALYALGYQQMRDYPIGTLDRLWRFTGRFSELVGPSFLDEDYRVRLWEVPTIVARDEAALPTEFRRLLLAFVDGIEDGRAWWRDGATPATGSARLKAMMGTTIDPLNVALHVDPLPDYLNEGFHQHAFDPVAAGNVHAGYDAADVPLYITRIVDRLFDASYPITVANVLSLCTALNSSPGLLYRAREHELATIARSFGSNMWLLSSAATGGNVVTQYDPHHRRDHITVRPYFVQVEGDQYQVGGVTMPGFPFIYYGFNDSLSWSFTGASKNDVVSRSTWGVELSGGLPLGFRVDGPRRKAGAGGLGRVQHQVSEAQDSLLYFDPVETDDADMSGTVELDEHVLKSQLRRRFYVPAKASLGFPNDRYPVVTVAGQSVDGLTTIPAPGDQIEFRQSSFTTSGVPFKFFWRLGRSQYIDNAPGSEPQVIDTLAEDLWPFDNNFLVADHTSRFYYLYMSKVPMQGTQVTQTTAVSDYTRIHAGSHVLDGSLLSARWQGFYDLQDLVQIGPVDVTAPEAWINCTSSPDLVEVGPSGATTTDDRLTLADLATYPPEIIRPQSKPSWRQARAAVAMSQKSLTAGALAGKLLDLPVDTTDPWMVRMWDFFKEARDIKVSELTGADPDFAFIPAVNDLIDWIETHRHLAPDGTTYSGAYDFVAHEYSLVTVYTTVMRSMYENALAALGDTTSLSADQSSFGDDPVHPLYGAGASSLVRPGYSPNIEMLWQAMAGTVTAPGSAALWSAGSSSTGLRNRDLLIDTWMIAPWTTDARYDDLMTSVDATFASKMAGDYSTRWGHVNMLILTPHLLAPGKAGTYAAASERLRGYVYMGLRPDLIAGLDLAGSDSFLNRLKHPVYQDQTPLAYPIGGVEDSLFQVEHQSVFRTSARPRGAQQALYGWNSMPDDTFFYVPHEHGSQTLLSVELNSPPDADAKFLCSTSATELTVPISAHHDRFATSADFAKGTWRDLELDEAVLIGTAPNSIPLSYTPVP